MCLTLIYSSSIYFSLFDSPDLENVRIDTEISLYHVRIVRYEKDHTTYSIFVSHSQCQPSRSGN